MKIKGTSITIYKQLSKIMIFMISFTIYQKKISSAIASLLDCSFFLSSKLFKILRNLLCHSDTFVSELLYLIYLHVV